MSKYTCIRILGCNLYKYDKRSYGDTLLIRLNFDMTIPDDSYVFYGLPCPISAWPGLNCEVQDHCITSPCSNGGQCISLIDRFTCTCKAGFRGERCTEDIDECQENPTLCRNGGICENRNGSFLWVHSFWCSYIVNLGSAYFLILYIKSNMGQHRN